MHESYNDVDLYWQLATSSTFLVDEVIASGSLTVKAHSSQCASAVASGLPHAPGTTLYYRFMTPTGASSAVGSFAGVLAENTEAAIASESDFTGKEASHLQASGEVQQPQPRRHLLQSSNITFQLLHINDVHAHIEGLDINGQSCSNTSEAAGTCIGGYARMATYINAARARGPVVLLDAGDQTMGTLWDVVYPNREATAMCQNLINFDAMTLGVHDFDYGIQMLAQYLDLVNSTLGTAVLGACNVDFSREPALAGKVQRWHILNVPGAQVGILGYITPEAAALSNTSNLVFNDVVSSLKTCMADFREANPFVEIIIALGHAGYTVDLQVAAQVPYIDVVVGGRSHTFLYGASGQGFGPLRNANDSRSGEAVQGPYPTWVGGPKVKEQPVRVPVVQASYWSKYVGALNLTFTTSGGVLLAASGNPVLMGGGVSGPLSVARDADMLGNISLLAPAVRQKEAGVVGSLNNTLPYNVTAVRSAESLLGDFVCDAMLWQVQNLTKLPPGVPHICLLNSGQLRAPLLQGNVTNGAVLSALPYGDTIAARNVSGLALLASLENSVGGNWSAGSPAVPKGGFLQVAGLRFKFNSGDRDGQRLRSVEVEVAPGAGQYAPLEPCMYYTVVTNMYMSNGGDGYRSIRAAAALFSDGTPIHEAVRKYLNASSPVGGYGVLQGRIIDCATLASPPAECSARRGFGTCPITFTLAHINDQHARIDAATASGSQCFDDPDEKAGVCYGGMARLATAMAGIRANGMPTLFLDAGDQTTGTLWDYAYRNRVPTAVAQTALAIDAFALGNHEFDWGVPSLVEYLKQLRVANMPVLSCNLDAPSWPDLMGLVTKYAVVEVGGTGVKVGIVGWITPDTAFISSGGSNVTFGEVVSSVAACTAELLANNQDVNIIIGLSHAGLASDLEVAAAVADIDLIVGAHDHWFLWDTANAGAPPLLNGSDPNSWQAPYREYPVIGINNSTDPGKKVPIVQAYYASRYLGAMQLAFDASGNLTTWSGQPMLLGGAVSSNNVARDPAMLQLIAQYGSPKELAGTQVIGSTSKAMTADRTQLRVRESELGDLVCEAMRWYLRERTALDVDLCFVNSGSIRSDIAAGDITASTIFDVLPFGNVLSVLYVTGIQLITALEWGLTGELTLLNNLNGRFPQISGLRFSYNDLLPAGSRLMDVMLVTRSGAVLPIDPCGFYTLVTNEFLARGGDNYTVLRAARPVFASGQPLDDVVREYITAHSPLTPALDGRIVRCTDNTTLCPPTRQVPDLVSPCPRQPPPSPPSVPASSSPPPQIVTPTKNDGGGGAADCSRPLLWHLVLLLLAATAHRLLP